MTSDRLLTLYHRLPSTLQSAAATARGLAMRSWRYGPDKGDGAVEATRREIVELGLEGAVGFAGAVAHEEISRYIAGADIFLNTTSFDNTPVRRSAFSKPWRVASAS
jgi:hypothetical protein